MSMVSKEERRELAEAAAEARTEERMTAKKHLEVIRRMEYSIEQKKQELQKLKEESSGVGGMSYDSVRVQTSKSGDRMSSAVARYVDLQREVEEEIEQKAEVRHRIINEIQEIDNPDYVSLLYKRYVQYKSLEQISVEMHYVYDYTRKQHGRALQAFEEKIMRREQNDNQAQKITS